MITNSEVTTGFAAIVREAIEGEDGATATDIICRAYANDRNGAETQRAALADGLKVTTARLRTSEDIVHTLHAVAAAELLRTARLDSFAQQLSRTVSQVRRLVRTAREAEEAPETLLRLIEDLDAALEQPDDAPVFPAQVVAFVPEQARDRSGQFTTPDGVVTASWPLVGWSLVVRQGVAERRLEPTFLLDGVTLPESGIVETYGMTLRQIL